MNTTLVEGVFTNRNRLFFLHFHYFYTFLQCFWECHRLYLKQNCPFFFFLFFWLLPRQITPNHWTFSRQRCYQKTSSLSFFFQYVQTSVYIESQGWFVILFSDLDNVSFTFWWDLVSSSSFSKIFLRKSTLRVTCIRKNCSSKFLIGFQLVGII